jgi:hypothetical protein
MTEDFRLSAPQIEFFRTFGFLKLPGLFKSEVPRLVDGFNEVFANQAPDIELTEDPLQQTDNPAFEKKRRRIIIPFIDRSQDLSWLSSDPRIVGIVDSIMAGGPYEAEPTDGHIFDCDTAWHRDFGFNSKEDPFRLKLSFYLDSQRANSGAIRVIPGTNFHQGPYATRLNTNLYGNPKRARENYGVEADQIPCTVIESDPGDLICWDYRTIHASFHGFQKRRLFSMTFRALEHPANA